MDSVGGLKVSNTWNVDGAVEKIIDIEFGVSSDLAVDLVVRIKMGW